MKIGRKYRFSDSQLRFRRGTGTEIAVVRHISNARELRVVAVIDLKSAYDAVPRETLQIVLVKPLDLNTESITALML